MCVCSPGQKCCKNQEYVESFCHILRGSRNSSYQEKRGAKPLNKPPRPPNEAVSVFGVVFFFAAGFFAGVLADADASPVSGADSTEFKSAGLPHASAFIFSRVEAYTLPVG